MGMLDKFDEFAQQLTINTKEYGERKLAPLLGTQQHFINEVKAGLEQDIHWYVVLKCRQIGLSTVSLALDLWWPATRRGLDGLLVTHDEPAREQFRSTLSTYIENLPREYRPPTSAHNRNQLVFKNGSRLQYAVAGLRKGGALGRSKAPTFLHATEISSWGDAEGIGSLKASLAQENPQRLFIWESTARGFNHFEEMWTEAKNATTQRAIFITWWHNDLYRRGPDTNQYRVYWGAGGQLTQEERRLTRDVKLLYGHDITPDQWAWYRWKGAEEYTDESLLKQEFPTTEEEAFQETGSQFFSNARLTELNKRVRGGIVVPQSYQINCGQNFRDTQLLVTTPKMAKLKVWEEYESGAQYALGADPAYGSSDWADRFVCSVWRCYADGMDQVAEFCDHTITTTQFAWVMAYLGGYYQPCMVNLEVNGPGEAVLVALRFLQKEAGSGIPQDRKLLHNVMGNMRQFRYSRADSVYAGTGVLHWKSSFQTKNRMMHTYRDYIERDMLNIRSPGLVHEMRGITEGESRAPEGSGRLKDDRVVAAGLATVAWDQNLRMRLIQTGRIRKRAQEPRTGVEAGGKRVINTFLQQVLQRTGSK